MSQIFTKACNQCTKSNVPCEFQSEFSNRCKRCNARHYKVSTCGLPKPNPIINEEKGNGVGNVDESSSETSSDETSDDDMAMGLGIMPKESKKGVDKPANPTPSINNKPAKTMPAMNKATMPIPTPRTSTPTMKDSVLIKSKTPKSSTPRFKTKSTILKPTVFEKPTPSRLPADTPIIKQATAPSTTTASRAVRNEVDYLRMQNETLREKVKDLEVLVAYHNSKVAMGQGDLLSK